MVSYLRIKNSMVTGAVYPLLPDQGFHRVFFLTVWLPSLKISDLMQTEVKDQL